MTWADFVLRLLLNRRDRDTISGDLLEEYREVILPARGPRRARWWYFRQILSFISPVTWGVAIGLAVGLVNLLDTAIEPLADDTPGVMSVWLGSLLLSWIVAGFSVARRSRRFPDVVVAGVLIGIASMSMLHLAAIVRVNVFLDELRYRGDWVNLLARYQASGFESLRVYANYDYIVQTPILLAMGAVAGAMTGAIAATVSWMTPSPSPNP